MRRNQFESFNVADAVLRLRGCPFGTTKDDVIKFFAGLDLVEGGIVIPNDEMGRWGKASSRARVLFVPCGFSARDYGIAFVRSLSVCGLFVCCVNHEISTEVSLRLL